MIFGIPKWVQKGGFISVLGVMGHLGRPSMFSDLKATSQGLQKVTPRSDNRLKKGAKVVEKLFPNLARRTAESGLNPPPPVKGGTAAEERACFLTGTVQVRISGPYLERL